MLKRMVLMICTALFICWQAVAQSEYYWVPDTTLAVEGRRPFNEVQVMDLRHDKANIGFASIGGFGGRRDLITEQPLDATLTEYLNRFIRQSTTPGKLLLILHDFSVEDAARGENVGSFRLSAEIYLSTYGGFRHLFEIDTFCETTAGNRDITKDVLQLASAVMRDVMASAIRKGAEAAPRNAIVYTATTAASRSDSVRNSYPLYAATSYQRGLYKTVDDLLNLRSDSTDFIDTRVMHPNEPDYSEFYYKNERGKKGAKISVGDYIAVCDGQRLFIARTERFTTLVKNDGEYYANLYRRGLALREPMMFFPVGGGIINAVVATAATVAANAAANRPGKKETVLYRCILIPGRRGFLPVKRIR